MTDKLTITEQKILEYARQWARCKLLGVYVDNGILCRCSLDDSDSHARGFMLMLESEAQLLIMEYCAEVDPDGKYLP
jgi:hypothetical protein